MKKLTAISILLVLLSTAAFAQLKVNFTSNLWTDAVFFQGATGDLADKDNVKGVIDIFSSSRFAGNELRLKFTYTGSHFEGAVEMKGDNLVTRGRDFFTNANTPTVSGTTDNTANTTLLRFLDQNFGDYYVKGTAGIFTGYLGTQANRGKVGSYRFADYTDFIKNKIENYGVIKFTPNASATNAQAFQNMVGSLTDTDNLKGSGVWSQPFVSFSLNFDSLGIPLVIDVASVLQAAGYANEMPSDSLEGPGGFGQTPASSRSAIAGSFRVSGGKFADFVSFDVIYKVRGTDADTLYESNVAFAAPVDAGAWENELGAYIGLDILKGLQVGAGYTAAFRVDENRRLTLRDGATVEKVNPVYNGIDLRLKATMIPNLAISLNNNLSFAWLQGENEISTTTGGRWIQPMGYTLAGFGRANGIDITGIPSFAGAFRPELDNSVAEGNMKNTDQKDGWFALWNSLGVSYTITPKVKVTLALSNRLGVYDFIAVPDDYYAKWTTDDFQAAVAGFYNFSSNVSFAAGLHLGIWGMTADITQSKTLTTGKVGEVKFAIPIQFKVTW